MLWKVHKRLVFPKCYFISIFIHINFLSLFMQSFLFIFFIISLKNLLKMCFDCIHSLPSILHDPNLLPLSSQICFLVIVLLFLPSKPIHATLIFLVVRFRWSMVNLPEAVFLEQILSLFQHLVTNFHVHDGILSGLNMHRDLYKLSQPL